MTQSANMLPTPDLKSQTVTIMKKEKKQNKLAEIEFHYKRFHIYYDYMMEQYFEPEYHQGDISFTENMKQLVEEDYKKKHLSNFRETTKEVNTWLREVLGSRAIEVKRLFHKQLGEDIEAEEKKYRKKLEAIAKRGKIRTEAEYQFIESRHHELFPEQGNTDEVMELDRLLGTFQVS